jgi:hypothetical protein
MLNIDNKSLNNLLQETTKEELINKLSLLFKNKKISYPWINFKISKEEVLEILKKIKKGESIEESKYYNNLNYFLIYYFSENEILDCKKKEKFITPNEIIYSNNNFLENMFNQLIYSNNSILFDDIKLYIKKNIGCCSINNIFYIINIIKNQKYKNICNIGIDWGEWYIISYIIDTININSIYFNNFNENNIKNMLNIKLKMIPKNELYDLIYINPDVMVEEKLLTDTINNNLKLLDKNGIIILTKHIESIVLLILKDKKIKISKSTDNSNNYIYFEKK